MPYCASVILDFDGVLDAVVKRKEPLMISNCCAFSLLEEKALEYVLAIEEVRLAAKEVAPIDQKGMRTHRKAQRWKG